MKPIYDIKNRKDVLETLIDIYTAISVQIETNSDINMRNKINGLHDETKKGIENYLEQLEDESAKIEFLKRNIEDIIVVPENEQEEKGMNFKDYYIRLIEKLDSMPLIEKNEQILLDMIKDSKVRIYEDKSEKDINSYGQFAKTQEYNDNEYLYQNKDMELIKIATYATQKAKKENSPKSKICTSLETKEINKYEYKLQYEKGKIATIEFFGDVELGNRIKSGNLKYIPPMLAAIELAKRNGREHIGRIEMIDKKLQTFVTQYDEELEMRVKELVEKEKQDKVKNKDTSLEEQK